MSRSLVGLGANIGDREHTLERAVEMLRAHPQIATLRQSRGHETTPIGGPPGQGKFLNAAVSFETTLSAEALQAMLAEIEHALGRTRAERWAARTIDLDLLLYGGEVIATPALVVPHPRMAFRRFVLEAAVEVAPNMTHPTIRWTIEQLLAHLNTSAEYVALLGLPGTGKTALGENLAIAMGGRFIAHPSAEVPTDQSADPPSPAWKRQIQFLGLSADLVAAEGGSEKAGLAVSDFYFDQCLSYARSELDDERYETFLTAWIAASERVVQPKLLVVLDAPPSRQPSSAEEGVGHLTLSHTTLPHNERLRRDLLRLAERPMRGPVLYVGGDVPAVQFDETTAAIAAMRSAS